MLYHTHIITYSLNEEQCTGQLVDIRPNCARLKIEQISVCPKTVNADIVSII